MSGLEGERPQPSKAGTSYGVRADAGDASPDEEEPTPRIVRKSGSKSPGLSAASTKARKQPKTAEQDAHDEALETETARAKKTVALKLRTGLLRDGLSAIECIWGVPPWPPSAAHVLVARQVHVVCLKYTHVNFFFTLNIGHISSKLTHMLPVKGRIFTQGTSLTLAWLPR